MAQLLHLGQDRWITVDTIFTDGGAPPRYALIGGQTVIISAGTPPKPMIFQCGNDFFYSNGSPVDRSEDLEYLPEPFKTQAMKYIGKESKTPIKITTSKPAVRGRGRPKKQTKMEIKDERSLQSVLEEA